MSMCWLAAARCWSEQYRLPVDGGTPYHVCIVPSEWLRDNLVIGHLEGRDGDRLRPL
jgi:hypothetical protein